MRSHRARLVESPFGKRNSCLPLLAAGSDLCASIDILVRATMREMERAPQTAAGTRETSGGKASFHTAGSDDDEEEEHEATSQEDMDQPLQV